MRTLIPVAVVLVTFVGSHAGGTNPVPKTPPAPTIDGKYTLVATSTGLPAGKGGIRFDPADGGPAAGGFGAGGFNPTRGPSVRSETVITKNEITIESRTPTGTSLTMEYTLDTSKTPIAIDAEIVNVRGKKNKVLGVVEIVGNRLTIALAKEGAERPKTTDEAEGVTVYYFQKAPPPPRTEFRIVALTAGKEADVEKELNQLARDGYELVSTTNPIATHDKAAVTTIHFVLKRITR